MTIKLSNRPETVQIPSLACRLQAEGRITWRQLGNIHLTYEDNDPEIVPVYIVKKRQLHVVTDADLRIQKLKDEQLPERLSGLRLSLYPI